MAIMPSTDIVTPKVVRGHQVMMISTPTVRQMARDYFGCPDLEGLELENEGGQCSIANLGSHWEKRLLYEDYMGPSSAHSFNAFALALLHDSGWYFVDFTNAEFDTSTYGRGRGCDFVRQPCLTAGNPPAVNDAEWFCNAPPSTGDPSGHACHPNGIETSFCGTWLYSSAVSTHGASCAEVTCT